VSAATADRDYTTQEITDIVEAAREYVLADHAIYVQLVDILPEPVGHRPHVA
jgi:hypothetical protein